MSDHVCKWTECEAVDTDYYWFECIECNRPAEPDEVLRALNVTEMLSGWLRSLVRVIEMHQEPSKKGFMSDDTLIDMIKQEARQHAEALEGKE